MNVGWLWLVSRGLFQAARMHKKLHLGVNFMFNYFGLLRCLRADGPLLDYSVSKGTSITSLLARRLAEFFLNIGFRIGFHSFGIRLCMAGPVIAFGFRRRKNPGGGGAASISSDSRQDIGNRLTSKLKLKSKN